MKKSARVSEKLVSPGLPGLQVATRLVVSHTLQFFYTPMPPVVLKGSHFPLHLGLDFGKFTLAPLRVLLFPLLGASQFPYHAPRTSQVSFCGGGLESSCLQSTPLPLGLSNAALPPHQSAEHSPVQLLSLPLVLDSAQGLSAY